MLYIAISYHIYSAILAEIFKKQGVSTYGVLIFGALEPRELGDLDVVPSRPAEAGRARRKTCF